MSDNEHQTHDHREEHGPSTAGRSPGDAVTEEQAHLDHAHRCLDHTRAAVLALRELERGGGNTPGAFHQREAVDLTVAARLAELEVGDSNLIFGRIDTDGPEGPEVWHIGRLAVADRNSEPVVVDWRAPVASAFYRATGRNPHGLSRRRHIHIDKRQVLDVEDERFGITHVGVGNDGVLAHTHTHTHPGRDCTAPAAASLSGPTTLARVLERGRSGQLQDIVTTIQAEQDEIIRSPLGGVVVVQGGPGTGKTVVALHRAAYLLYTHRFPLRDQGLLVVGPHRLFMRYVARVLPGLGENGATQVTVADLVDVTVSGREDVATATVKAGLRMAELVAHAIRDRQRPLREDLVVPFGAGFVRLRQAETVRIVERARRLRRRHNQARAFVEREVWQALAASCRDDDTEPDQVRSSLRRHPAVRQALERMWPTLSAAQLLHDLYGSKALLRLAGRGRLTEVEVSLLHRARSASVEEVSWTDADVALLDEARYLLGPGDDREPDDDGISRYGHIVIDEAQDLTPMQLRMLARRSLNGSFTAVGDLTQATGVWVPPDWTAVTDLLAAGRPVSHMPLTIGYRIPASVMDFAEQVRAEVTPDLPGPQAVRDAEHALRVVHTADVVAESVSRAIEARADCDGTVAVIVADRAVDGFERALDDAGVRVGFGRDGVAVIALSTAKGLELDMTVVVEPDELVAQEGLRGLYVALTRAARRLDVVHQRPLPDCLRP